MSSAESINSGLNLFGESMESGTTLLLVTKLGDNNRGTIGPEGTEEQVNEITDYVSQRVADPEYCGPASNEWMCVDGRVPKGALAQESIKRALANQTGGGLPITELSNELMLSDSPETVSKVLAAKTRETIANGQKVFIHGDSHAHYAGCGCNKGQRPILLENAANVDIVTPIAWDLGKSVGLDKHLSVEDVTNMIITGGHNAQRDELWDATPEEKTQIILDNGGEYVELEGDHAEYVARIDTTEQAFDVVKFVRDNVTADGKPIMAFNVSLGRLKKYYFDLASQGKLAERDAALRTMGAILHNGGTTKWLANENLHAAIVGSKA